MTVQGKVREQPDIEIHPAIITLKMLSKFVFLTKEELERVLIRHISFNGGNKSIWLDKTKIIE